MLQPKGVEFEQRESGSRRRLRPRGIKNGLHWLLNIAFDDERDRIRKDHGAENLATLRKLALNTIKRPPSGISIRRKRKRSG